MRMSSPTPTHLPVEASARRPTAIYRLLGVTVAAMLLGAAACGGDDDDGPRANINSEPTETTKPSGGEEAKDNENENSGGDLNGSTPQDRDNLGIEQRHRGGTSVKLNSISFENDNINVDLEFFNGSAAAVTLHSGYEDSTLRLVDDSGNAYYYAQPDDESGGYLELAQGETKSGTLVFLGPLVERTDQLHLVTNIYPDDVEDFQPEDAYVATTYPEFKVAIDLEW